MIVKKCYVCHKYYPGKLKDPITLCPKHNISEHQKYLVNHFKKSRGIPIHYFDVWNNDYVCANGSLERVCRICGKRLLRKDGKYSHVRRHCCNPEELLSFYFNSARYDYLEELHSRQTAQIALQYIDSIYTEDQWYWLRSSSLRGYICCEVCGKLVGSPELHHKIPVSILDETNYHLIWDPSNFQALCHDCHAKAPGHKLFRQTKPQEIEKKYQTLDNFL